MIVYVLATHQARLETIYFSSEKLCTKAVSKVENISAMYPLSAVCVLVKP
jgi:hypothetical protein